MCSRMTSVFRIFSTINGVNVIRISYFFQGQAKRIAIVVFSVILLVLDSPLAEAEFATETLGVSVTVMPSCGISLSTSIVLNSDAEISGEINDIKFSTVLKSRCNTGSDGTMALSVGTNITGKAVIRIISNDQSGGEFLTEAYLSDDGRPVARPISLGIFPDTGEKVISIQTDNLVGSYATPGADQQKMTLNIDF